MRIHILGDLHLEFGTTHIPATDADVIVLAGDIHLGREGRRWARRRFGGKPVVYILGNHEFYRHSLPDLTESLKRETDGSQIPDTSAGESRCRDRRLLVFGLHSVDGFPANAG